MRLRPGSGTAFAVDRGHGEVLVLVQELQRQAMKSPPVEEIARAIVRTIINLARTLGMNTVAEGVEEPAQLAVLQQAGCMVTQGFLIAKPMPLDDFKDLLSNWEDGHAPELGPIPQTDFAQLEALRSTQKAWSATLA